MDTLRVTLVSLERGSSGITSTRRNVGFEMVLLRPLARAAPIGAVKLRQKLRSGGDGEEPSESRAGSAAALCVEDDLWDLSVLHRGAVVIPGRVTEGEAGFGSRCRGLVDDFAQSFGSIVGIWTLRRPRETRTGQDGECAPAGRLGLTASFGGPRTSLFTLALAPQLL